MHKFKVYVNTQMNLQDIEYNLARWLVKYIYIKIYINNFINYVAQRSCTQALICISINYATVCEFFFPFCKIIIRFFFFSWTSCTLERKREKINRASLAKKNRSLILCHLGMLLLHPLEHILLEAACSRRKVWSMRERQHYIDDYMLSLSLRTRDIKVSINIDKYQLKYRKISNIK